MPIPRLQIKSALEQATVEHRPCGPTRRRWILLRADRGNARLPCQQSLLVRLTENLHGELMPGAGRATAVMIEPPLQHTLISVAPSQFKQDVGDAARMGRTAKLI